MKRKDFFGSILISLKSNQLFKQKKYEVLWGL